MGLYEKMEYVGGVLPRGIVMKTVSLVFPDKGENPIKTLLNVSGSGYIFYAQCLAYYGWAKLTITIDGNKIITFGNMDICDGERKSVLSVDLNSITPTDTIKDYPYTFDFGSSTRIINELLQFKTSIKIEAEANNSYTAGTANVKVIYAIA